ncbi:MAG: hypothetical protein HN416_08485 [Nitrospina sp.]|jgi:hypothetical protein|nr:hypothetical protein [Nitrospina sp.]
MGYHLTIMKYLTSLATGIALFFIIPLQAWGYDYQLYKNHEDFAIVVFPKKYIDKELDDYIASISFKAIESGKAVMRRGSKNENESLMMPLEVQKKHSIEKFIVIQVLGRNELLIGIYDPEWGLTLPSTPHRMDALKKNIPKTLNIFRGGNPQRQTRLQNHHLIYAAVRVDS